MLKDVGCSSTSARVFELFGGDERVASSACCGWTGAATCKAVRFHFAYAAPASPGSQRAERAIRLVARRLEAGGRAGRDARAPRRGDRAPARLQRRRWRTPSAALDERWDGGGQPRGTRAAGIPLLARIIALAQFLEVFATVQRCRDPAVEDGGAPHRGSWFDPSWSMPRRGTWSPSWRAGRRSTSRRCAAEVREREPGDAALLAGPGTLDRIAAGFADVVDAKSPFTAQHSSRVSELCAPDRATGSASTPRSAPSCNRAALLHDIGKLSVPNSILDKPGPLDAEEWESVRLHPYYTQRILEHIRGFERLAAVAALHHERLDGRGYFHGLRDEQIPLASQVLATADIYDALTAARPYRPALPEEVALKLLEQDRGTGLRPNCLDALIDALESGDAAAEARAA